MRCAAHGMGETRLRAHIRRRQRWPPLAASLCPLLWRLRRFVTGQVVGGVEALTNVSLSSTSSMGFAHPQAQDLVLGAQIPRQPASPGPTQLREPWGGPWNFPYADSVWRKCHGPGLFSGPPGARRHTGSRRWRPCGGCGTRMGTPPPSSPGLPNVVGGQAGHSVVMVGQVSGAGGLSLDVPEVQDFIPPGGIQGSWLDVY